MASNQDSPHGRSTPEAALARATPRLRNALLRAAEEADRRGDVTVGTEHVLIAILRDGQTVATGVIRQIGVSSRELMTPREAADRLGVSAATVNRWILRDILSHVKLPSGGARAGYRIPVAVVDALLAGGRSVLQGGRTSRPRSRRAGAAGRAKPVRRPAVTKRAAAKKPATAAKRTAAAKKPAAAKRTAAAKKPAAAARKPATAAKRPAAASASAAAKRTSRPRKSASRARSAPAATPSPSAPTATSSPSTPEEPATT